MTIFATSAKQQDIRSQMDCEKLADQISSMSELPAACQKYSSVVEKVKAKEPEIDPFAGMAGGQAVSAKAARAGGRENRAQLQRRMTTSRGR